MSAHPHSRTGLYDEIDRLQAGITALIKRFQEVAADRDEWKQQHENLLDVHRRDLEALAARLRTQSERTPTEIGRDIAAALSSDKPSAACREAFEKAGYWPNDVMWRAWQQAWTAALASLTSQGTPGVADAGGARSADGLLPRGSYEPLTREAVEVWRKHWNNAPRFTDDAVNPGEVSELNRLCDMAISSLLYAQEIERLRTQSARTPTTNGEIMEEFLDRDEAIWALIDEVLALRRGVGMTHSRDPIPIITAKYFGISSREHIARTRETIAKSRATSHTTDRKANE